MSQITTTDIHLHLIGCDCDDALLHDGAHAVDHIARLVDDVGLTAVGKTQHTVPDHHGNGASYIAAVLLVESHVIVHTWPERDRTVMGDISICHYSRDNSDLAHRLLERLVELFRPRRPLVSIPPYSFEPYGPASAIDQGRRTKDQ